MSLVNKKTPSVRYYSRDFFYSGKSRKKDSFQITDEDIKKIKKLKAHRSNRSGYYDVMLQWRLSDNKDIVKDKNELSRLYVAMQFISMTGIIREDFIKSYNKPLEKYHINLLRGLYLDLSDYSGDENLITMEFKRPFGNSHVLGDVRNEINKIQPMTQIQLESEDYSREGEILLEFIDFLEEFFKGGFELKCNYFIYYGSDFSKQINYEIIKERWLYIDCQPHNYLCVRSSGWSFDISEVRNQKIEKILN
jgi:hypothetical protein